MSVQFMRRGASGATFDGRHGIGGGNFAQRGPHLDLGISSLAVVQRLVEAFAPCPWPASAGSRISGRGARQKNPKQRLYTPEERVRRDRSPWTLVQGVLAPIQFVIFIGSAALVARYLLTGLDYRLATISIIIKTIMLYSIMITGSIWERKVFGKWLFAKVFFWEDVFSILVLVLQSAYVCALLAGFGSRRQQMIIAVAAYAAYLINATQFLLKLRAARLQDRDQRMVPAGAAGRP